MIRKKFRTVFVRWNDENKLKAIETIGDDEMKSVVTYDRARAYEMFKERLNDESFNEAFGAYYKPIRDAIDERKANMKRRVMKNPSNRVEEIDNAIKTLQDQIARLQIERDRAEEVEREKALHDVKKMIAKLSPEQRNALLSSLQNSL